MCGSNGTQIHLLIYEVDGFSDDCDECVHIGAYQADMRQILLAMEQSSLSNRE